MYLLRILLTLVVAVSVVLGKPAFWDYDDDDFSDDGDFCSTVDESDDPQSPQVQSDSVKTWPNGIVYYVIANGVFNKTEKRKIKKAMKDLEQHGIRFKRRTDEEDYVLVTRVKPYGCNSNAIGRKGGMQIVHLGPRCMRHGTIVHELMHALGFHHEHTRSDRDEFVKILRDNIKEEKKHNFNIRKRPMIYDTVDYDFKSIMHYEWDTFAKVEGTPTIIPLEQHGVPAKDIGPGETLTRRDIKKLKILYP